MTATWYGRTRDEILEFYDESIKPILLGPLAMKREPVRTEWETLQTLAELIRDPSSIMDRVPIPTARIRRIEREYPVFGDKVKGFRRAGVILLRWQAQHKTDTPWRNASRSVYEEFKIFFDPGDHR